MRENPLRYASGVVRSLLLFLGMPALESENDFFTSAVVSDSDTVFKRLHPRYLEDEDWNRLKKWPAPSAFRAFEASLAVPFSSHAVVLISNGAALALLILTLARRDLVAGSVPLLVFYFYALHSVTLLSIDRYAFPAYYLLQGAVVLAAVKLLGYVRPLLSRMKPQSA